MEQNVLNTDLTGKVAVVTGASGTLCSIFAKALARAGAKVALLGRNMEKLKALADEIEAEGGIARGYTCNVMNKANCLQVAEDVMAELGSCDILVNGAGGNNARANTDKEYFESLKLLDEAGPSRLSLAAEGILVTFQKARHTAICRQKSAAFCEMTLEKAFFTQVVSGCISGVVVLDVR